MSYSRAMTGYGRTPPDPYWPGNARVAVNVVVNWEEGGEHNVLHGDAHSESAINDVTDATPRSGERDLRTESMFEYGSRAGIWRLHRILTEREVPYTVFAVGMAVERSPSVISQLAADGVEICAHHYRWIDYHDVNAEIEREHISRTVTAIEQATGQRPVGWYCGRTSPRTRELVYEEGGFFYDSDDYSDDLPFWVPVGTGKQLVIPYSFDINDMRYVTSSGFSSGNDFADYTCDSFDQLYEEGATSPKMMTIGLHCRIAGRPGRARAVARVLDHIRAHDRVWFARRDQIAAHWRRVHPA